MEVLASQQVATIQDAARKLAGGCESIFVEVLKHRGPLPGASKGTIPSHEKALRLWKRKPFEIPASLRLGAREDIAMPTVQSMHTMEQGVVVIHALRLGRSAPSGRCQTAVRVRKWSGRTDRTR